jgi:DNA-binding GntR family transcriptional regulator
MMQLRSRGRAMPNPAPGRIPSPARVTTRFLYQQVAGELRHRISTGVYPPGAKIPPEPELVREFRVSAITVRRAIRDLAVEGLLSARQGLGVFVTNARQIIRVFGSNPQATLLEQIRQAGFEPGYGERSLTLVPADDEIARRLGCRREALVYRHEKLLLADAEPVVLDITHLARRVRDLVDGSPFVDAAIAALVARGTVPDHTDYRFCAVAASEEQSASLNVPLGFPLQAVDYTFVGPEGAPLLAGRLFARSDRLAYQFCGNTDLHKRAL